jgi:hypothetical protein
MSQTTHTERAGRTLAERANNPASEDQLNRARVAVAHGSASRYGRTLSPVLTGGAVRVLLALEAACDDGGRVRTGAGANLLFDSKTYYQHVGALIEAGHVRRIIRSQAETRFAEITSTGRTVAAKAWRMIEKDARLFIKKST